jgi:hypothetical protein
VEARLIRSQNSFVATNRPPYGDEGVARDLHLPGLPSIVALRDYAFDEGIGALFRVGFGMTISVTVLLGASSTKP